MKNAEIELMILRFIAQGRKWNNPHILSHASKDAKIIEKVLLKNWLKGNKKQSLIEYKKIK